MVVTAAYRYPLGKEVSRLDCRPLIDFILVRTEAAATVRELLVPTFTNPIVASGADPWVIRWEKHYYYCFSRDDRVYVSRAASLVDIGRGKEVAVWTPPPKMAYSKELWAPELHRLGERFYIYVAADDGDNAHHRMYALEGDARDPQAPFRLKGRVAAKTNRWAIDGTVGMINGHPYFVWSGWEGTENVRQDLYIAAMTDPWALSGERACLSVPGHPWEKLGPEWAGQGFPGGVLEGPQFLTRGRQTHIIYSANGSWTDDYCLGRLTYTGGDPLARASWRKAEKPVFARTDKVFGPGHACFARTADGKEDWIVYHAAKRKGGGWDRDVRAQPFGWDPADSPRFGQPVPAGVPLERPRGD